MRDPDLFDPPPPEKVCGECVMWNGYHGGKPDHGGCSILGARKSEDEGCRRWFPKTQMMSALYGRQTR